MFQRDIRGTHILARRRRHQGGHVTLKKQKKMAQCMEIDGAALFYTIGVEYYSTP
jgi:hypothetical protein